MEPNVPVSAYRDGFGNRVSRIVAPKGQVKLTSDAMLNDSGLPDVVAPHARERTLPELPDPARRTHLDRARSRCSRRGDQH